MKYVCQNRRARREYEILDTIEAGLVLQGTEVKSLRDGRANLQDSFGEIDGGELWLVNFHISPYTAASHFQHEAKRRRKLLVSRRDIVRLAVKINERGLTLIPLSVYFKGPWAKVELALARGKKFYDKRQDLAERESRREMERAVRGGMRGDRGRRGGGDMETTRVRWRPPLFTRWWPAFASLALLASAVGLAPTAAEARDGRSRDTIQVVRGTARQSERVPVQVIEGERYLSINTVGRWMGAAKQWDPNTLRMRLRARGREIVLAADNPWVLLDGVLHPLPTPVLLSEGVLQVPVTFMERVAAEVLDVDVTWQPDKGVLRLLPRGVNILDVEMATAPNGALDITVSLADSLLFAIDLTRERELWLKIAGGRIEEGAPETWKPLLPVRAVRGANRERGAELLFELAVTGGTVAAFPIRDGHAIRIQLTGFLPEESTDLPLLQVRPLPQELMARVRAREETSVIVIDAGHGGSERGATGPNGFLEKKANLDIALHLKEVLEREGGYQVLLTRESDRLVPLVKRAQMANVFGADLFVSIHCNGWQNDRAEGFEVYTLTPRSRWPAGGKGDARWADATTADGLPPSPWGMFEAEGDFESGVSSRQVRTMDDGTIVIQAEKSTTEAEGATAAGGPGGGAERVSTLLWDEAQEAQLDESRRLANMVAQEMRRLPVRERGIKEGRFAVLTGVGAPAVLVETAFITNPHEESLLMNEGYRQRVGEALAGAVRRFIASREEPETR